MDYLNVANSYILWIATAIPVMLVLFQAYIFMKKSLSAGKELGITNNQIKSAVRSSFVASIGPSIVIMIGMVSLLVSMGGPIAWMRLAMIGTLPYEMLAASIGVKAAGAELGTASMTGVAFATGAWVMILGSLGWLISTGLFAHKTEKLQHAMAKGRKELIPIIATASMLGAFTFISAGYMINVGNETIALVGGGLAMLALTKLINKKKLARLNEWAFAIAMVFGMLAGIVF